MSLLLVSLRRNNRAFLETRICPGCRQSVVMQCLWSKRRHTALIVFPIVGGDTRRANRSRKTTKQQATGQREQDTI
jgi:hypothetical protein